MSLTYRTLIGLTGGVLAFAVQNTYAQAPMSPANDAMAKPAKAPAFEVSSVTSSTAKFRLADAKGKYVAIHFLLKTECPICLKHTRDYATRGQAGAPDVVQVFLKPDAPGDIEAWAKKLPIPQFPGLAIYSDPNATIATKYAIPGGYKFHGEEVHYPALVIVDPAGNEVFRYVGKSNTDRFTVDQFLPKIAELKAASKSNKM